jgi:formate--tetrahydrofolate ligase
VKGFGVPVVVGINHFAGDTEAEIEAVKAYVAEQGSEAILCRHWAEGGAGIEEMATRVAELAESGAAQFAPLYPDEMPLFEKIETIAKSIYHAERSDRRQEGPRPAAGLGGAGLRHLPVCMAKTQYSFSTDPNLRGAPTGHSVPVREVRLSAGAGFVVVICGEIMTMPGLPRSARRRGDPAECGEARSKGCSGVAGPGRGHRAPDGRAFRPPRWGAGRGRPNAARGAR